MRKLRNIALSLVILLTVVGTVIFQNSGAQSQDGAEPIGQRTGTSAAGITDFEMTATSIVATHVSSGDDADLQNTLTSARAAGVTDFELTATALIDIATMQAILLTEQPTAAQETLDAFYRTQTVVATEYLPTALAIQTLQVDETQRFANAYASRTAIAVTRDSSLLTPIPPSPLQMTDTALREGSADSYNNEQTTTPFPADYCYPITYRKDYNPALALELNQELIERNDIPPEYTFSTTITVSGDYIGRRRGNRGNETYTMDGCGEDTLLAVTIRINQDGIDSWRTAESLVNATMDVLSDYPDIGSDGVQRPRLLIVEGDWVRSAFIIDSDFRIALVAYNDGLRGDELIRSMGGFVPQGTG